MPPAVRRARVLTFPYDDVLFDGRLDTLSEERGSRGNDIIFGFRSFRVLAPPTRCLINGKPHELARGEYVPMRLRFRRAEWLWRTGPYAQFDELPPSHEARRLFGMLHYRQPGIGEYYLAATGTIDAGNLGFRAHAAELDSEAGPAEEVEILRCWASTPSLANALVPHRASIYRKYGGDPITIQLGERQLRNRLFIGGLHHQRDHRPTVDGVLNLCGVENPWWVKQGHHADDRFECKGEGAAGMSPAELLTEAEWVAERLRAGQRVLVHCYAGVNRSSTVCCAALMLLEGITPEAALARVRELHPTAWPDPYHWFALRWLSYTKDEVSALPDLTQQAHGAPLLREVGQIQ